MGPAPAAQPAHEEAETGALRCRRRVDLGPGWPTREILPRFAPAAVASPGMAIAAVSISPVGVGVSVSRYVTAAVQVVRTQDRVGYRLDPMFTTLEGDIADIFDLVRRMQDAVFEAGAQRVGTVIKIDDRRDRDVRMQDKVRAVEEQL